MKTNSLTLVGGVLSNLRVSDLPAGGVLLEGQLAVDDATLYRYTGDSWEVVTAFYDRPLFAFSTHQFTVAGKTGPTGPTQAACVAAYAAAPWAANSAFFSVAAGVQKFTVPETADYEIILHGSIPLANDTRVPRRCYAIINRITLTKGEILSILVGQRPGALWHGGTGDYSGCQVGAACGGTFVESSLKGLLAVAGGQVLRTGGTTYSERTGQGVPGDYMTAAGVVTQSTVTIGNGGIAVTNSRNGGVPAVGFGGGGYNTDGAGTGGGKAYKNGGAGGSWTGVVGNLGTVTSSGGFGGGAAAQGSTETNASNRSAYASGGAGGYTGGNGSAGTINVSGYLPGNGASWVIAGGSIQISPISMERTDATVTISKLPT